MLKLYCADVPDLHFEVHMLASQPPIVASRLVSNCTPGNTFLGLPVHRKRISFSESAFYRFKGEKIQQIWSVIDGAVIEAQL
jgi:predicted ester cyclase